MMAGKTANQPPCGFQINMKDLCRIPTPKKGLVQYNSIWWNHSSATRVNPLLHHSRSPSRQTATNYEIIALSSSCSPPLTLHIRHFHPAEEARALETARLAALYVLMRLVGGMEYGLGDRCRTAAVPRFTRVKRLFFNCQITGGAAGIYQWEQVYLCR